MLHRLEKEKITVKIMISHDQVLSNSVSKALQLFLGEKAEKTALFVAMFDKFFDCLNVRNFTEGKRTRNPFKDPYRSPTDYRIKVL